MGSARPLVVAALALGLLVPLQLKVDAVRREHRLTSSGDELRGRSPVEVIASVGLGGFKGLAVDYLWFRATQMQHERRFYEIALLCRLILKMEPYFTHIWAYHAWNMAYNISVEASDAEGRWRWIEQAIKLLEEEGIPRNADSYVLYWELGWIYSHRCTPRGGDEHARYFARKLAEAHPELEGRDVAKAFALAELNFRAAARKDDISPMKRRLAERQAVHCLEARGDWAGAERDWRRLVAEAPEGEHATEDGFIGFYKGVVFRYHVAGELEDARTWYGKFQRAFPNEAPSYEDVVKEMERDIGEAVRRDNVE